MRGKGGALAVALFVSAALPGCYTLWGWQGVPEPVPKAPFEQNVAALVGWSMGDVIERFGAPAAQVQNLDRTQIVVYHVVKQVIDGKSAPVFSTAPASFESLSSNYRCDVTLLIDNTGFVSNFKFTGEWCPLDEQSPVLVKKAR